jgi:FkbM family methyltransferase
MRRYYAVTSVAQVMKIDVEGFELEVLQGAQGLLQKYNVW